MLKLVRREGSESWWVRGTIAGKRHFESTRTADEGQAKAYAAKRQKELYDHGHLGRTGGHTFGQALDVYLEAKDDIGHATRRYLIKLLDSFGDRPLSDITQATLDSYIRAHYGRASGSTVNRSVIVPITAVMRSAYRRGWCGLPMFERRKEKKSKPRFLSHEEARQLMRPCREEFRALLSFMMNTGCRVGEALTLQWYAVDLDRRTVTFGMTEQDRTKNDEARVVPLNKIAHGELFFIPHRDGTVFLNSKGRPYAHRTEGGGAISKPFKTALTRSGIEPCRVHDLRHTTASWLAMAGQREATISEILGHKRPGVTARYAHLDIEHLRAAVESIVARQVSIEEKFG